MKTKFRMLLASITFIAALALLFAALALPGRLAAQQNHKFHHYKLIDMGTLGGPNSSVVEATRVLNNQGASVGQADTSTPDPNYPNCPIPVLPCDPFIEHAFQWTRGVLTDLGALPGDNSSLPFWISGNGLIAGISENRLIDPMLGVPEIHAVLWRNGQITDLGTLEGGYESVASAVNRRGQVVGVSTNLIADPFSPLGTQNRTFLWQNGVMHDLGTLGTGTDAGLLGIEGAVEINERGQVVACSYTNTTRNRVTGTPTLDPFLWENGTLTDLGSLGGTSGCATFINDHGQVVGYSNLAGDLTSHAFLWEAGQLRDLGTLGGPTAIAYWINESGAVVGNGDLPGSPGCSSPNLFHGFLWKDGAMTDIGTLPGTDCSTAVKINAKTQIVGASFNLDFSVVNAILWENGSLVDLNTLIPPGSALHLDKGEDINERGEIAGFGSLPNGDVRAFLLIPCDENHPGLEGCAYSLVEAPAAIAQPVASTRGVTNRTLTQSFLRRLSRYRSPGGAFGPG
jgi:probable HAF family extracellular repeat protein